MAADKKTTKNKKNSGKKGDKKVAPAKKKIDDKGVKEKGRQLLMKHPEVINNARRLFRNENGTTIVQERVPRGDVKQEEVIMPRNQADLKDDDLRGLVVYASGILDPVLVAYDKGCANMDALERAVWEKDGGIYDGKINANTFATMLGYMGGIKKAAAMPAVVEVDVVDEKKEKPDEKSDEEKEEKPKGLERGKEVLKRQIEKVRQRPEAPEETEEEVSDETEGETPEEDTMDKKVLRKEKEALEVKVAALDVLIGDEGTEKEAGKADMTKCPTCGTKVLKATGYCLKCKKKIGGGKKEKEAAEDTDAVEEAAEDLSSMGSVTVALGKVAADLEAANDFDLFKIAFEIDRVCDVLDGSKEAKTLESQPDEAYMKKYFQAGARETDSDEPFMKEFNNDNTTEVERVVGNVSVEHKNASENKVPYQKKNAD